MEGANGAGPSPRPPGSGSQDAAAAAAGVLPSTVQHKISVPEAEQHKISVAERLLRGGPLQSVVAKWRRTPDQALNQHLKRLRDSVRDIAGCLQARGLDSGLEDDGLEQAEGRVEEGGMGCNAGGVEQQQQGVGAGADFDPCEWEVPPFCVPIHANVTTYDWSHLALQSQFDVIMMDPPWQLATANPTRGVALGYSQLSDQHIAALPVPRLQSNGLLFVWVINAKYKWTLDLFDSWGYK